MISDINSTYLTTAVGCSVKRTERKRDLVYMPATAKLYRKERKAEKTFQTCEHQAKRLKNFLNGQFERLLWHTERM